METYIYPETIPSLDLLLDQALHQGMVKVKRSDGNTFVIKPEPPVSSPLDVEGINVEISTEEIIDIIRERREKVDFPGFLMQRSDEKNIELNSNSGPFSVESTWGRIRLDKESIKYIAEDKDLEYEF